MFIHSQNADEFYSSYSRGSGMNDTLETIAKSVVRNTPRGGEIEVMPRRLEALLTQTLLPSIGLHVALIASLFLFSNDPRLFGFFLPVFLVCLGGAILNILIRGIGADEVSASRQTNAIFCFGVISLFAVNSLAGGSVDQGSEILLFAGLLVVGYSVVAFLCWRGYVQPLSLVVIGVYTAAFFQFFQPDPDFLSVIAVTVICFGLGSWVVYKMRRMGYMFGFVVGALTVVVMSSGGNLEDNALVLVGFASLSIVALVIFELATSKAQKSEFARFAAQGFGVAIVAIASIVLVSEPDIAGLITLGIFVGYTAFLFTRQGRDGLGSHLLWIILLVW
jgi:hypothetical protein